MIRTMLFATFMCLLLYVGRCWLMGSVERMGIYTNILLAWIPYLLAILVDDVIIRKPVRKSVLIPLLVVWLLFLPNAAYIITDLVHWRKDKILPVWYDWIFISAVAWVGLFLAYLSVQLLHHRIMLRWGKFVGWLFVVFTAAASSFGIYVGRFFRWNSWDVLVRQHRLFGGLDALTQPATTLQVLGFCITYTVFLLMVYVMLNAISNNHHRVSRLSAME